MIFLKRVVLFFCILIPGQLLAANFTEGRDYTQLPAQVRSEKLISHLIAKDPKKVQVLFFFSYGCPACARFDSFFEKWEKGAKDSKTVIYKMPVSFEEHWGDLARLYFVTQNLLPKKDLSPQIFAAIHKQGLNLWEQSAMQNFLVKQGYKAQEVATAYDSFKVKEQASNADDISKEYDINQTPTIVINGPKNSYVLTVGQAGGDYSKLIAIMNYVISAQVHK